MIRTISAMMAFVFFFAAPASAGSLTDESQEDLTPKIALENREHVRGVEGQTAANKARIEDLEQQLKELKEAYKRSSETPEEGPLPIVVVTPIEDTPQPETVVGELEGALEQVKIACAETDSACDSELSALEARLDALVIPEERAHSLQLGIGWAADVYPFQGYMLTNTVKVQLGLNSEGDKNGHYLGAFAKIGPPKSIGAGVHAGYFWKTSDVIAVGLYISAESHELGLSEGLNYRNHQALRGDAGFSLRVTVYEGVSILATGGPQAGLWVNSPRSSASGEGTAQLYVGASGSLALQMHFK